MQRQRLRAVRLHPLERRRPWLQFVQPYGLHALPQLRRRRQGIAYQGNHLFEGPVIVDEVEVGLLVGPIGQAMRNHSRPTASHRRLGTPSGTAFSS